MTSAVLLPAFFHIDCTDQPEQVKTAINVALSDWSEPRESPRGWIAGPFMCLWRTAITNDNTVYALILRDGWRTRIVGSTLSQLARSLFIYALIISIAWLVAGTIQGDMFSVGTLPLALLCVAVLGVLILWPKSSREARTVTFLRETVGAQGSEYPLPTFFEKPAQYGEPRAMELIVSGRTIASPATADAVVTAFRAMEDGEEEFVILAAGEQEFLQSAPLANGFLVEWRDGDGDRYFVAESSDRVEQPLTIQDALRLASDFLHEAEWPENTVWAKRWA